MTSFDAKLSDDQQSVAITIDIDEGEPIRVEQVVLNGFDPVPQNRRDELRKRLPLQGRAGRWTTRWCRPGGKPRSRSSASTAIRTPTVGSPRRPGISERQRILTYTAQPGRIALRRADRDHRQHQRQRTIVRRQLTFRPGELFQASRLRESQRKLYSLELFEFVNVEPVTGSGDSAVQGAEATAFPTRVTVTEGKHRKVNFGVGYGTEEKARGEVDWRHVNFFGGARTAGVFARYSSSTAACGVNFRQPYFFNRRYSLSA